MNKPSGCSECPLVNIGQGFTRIEGAATLGVAFIGEFSGKHEIQEGLPFRPNSESGSLMTHIVERNLKLKRSDFLWDSVVRCQPPGNQLSGCGYEAEAIRNCSMYSHERWNSDSGIRVIVALGFAAFKALTGIEGKKRTIEDVRGYVFKSDFGLVVPSLHPSFIRRGHPRFTSALIHDIKKALAIASGRYGSYDIHSTYVAPSLLRSSDTKLAELVALYYKLKADPSLTIYYDIENPYTKNAEEEDKGEDEEEANEELAAGEISYEITSIQFAYSKTWAITVPWEKPFIKVAQAILALPNDKVGSNNWHHDDPRLRANGCTINGTIHDLMWAWHHLQPGLWKGLQRIASFFDFPYIWKHLALEADKEDEYGGSDVIAPAYIWPKLQVRMRQNGVWESYLKFKVRYRQVLHGLETRGLFVDETERQELAGWLGGEIEKEDLVLQSEVPMELRNLEPKRKDKKTGEVTYGYIREPKVITDLRTAYLTTRTRLECRGVFSENIVPFEKWAESRSGLSLREFERAMEGATQESVFSLGSSTTSRWCRVNEFKASSDQLIRYMKHMGYKIPLTLKTKKETTNKKDLYEVFEKTNDKVLESVIKIRSLSKMLSNDIPNWTPAIDGCVHTTFKFDPPSLQLNSSSPNIQNARKHEPDPIAKLLRLGERFRKIVKAPPGRCVVEFDKSAFHVVMMGFEARDPLYIKWAKLDMHTVLTSYIVNQPIPLTLSEADARIAIKEIKKHFKVVRDTQGKPTVLGNQLGLGAYKLWWMNKTYIDENGVRRQGIPNKKRAEQLQELLAGLFPVTERYKDNIIEQAYYKTYLTSNYGVIRWFFDVLKWDYKTRSMKRGSEAEEAQSHCLQSDAFGMIHSEIIDMADTSELLEEHWVANTVHDSIVAFPEVGKLDRCIEEIRGYMLKPEKPLSDPVCCPDGLVVGVDVQVSAEGGNWAPFHQDRNPMGLREIKI